MSIVELGRLAHRHCVNLFCAHRLVFHHVPKCGGTSVGRSLRRAYVFSQATVTPVESEKAFNAAKSSRPSGAVEHVSELREMMLLYMLYSDVRCVSAHLPFSDIGFDSFGDRYSFVTLLRDPVERFISNYYWNYSRSQAHFRVAESFGDFLSTERARGMGSTYVRYFCGQPGQEFSAQHVDAAIRNLHRMHLVGFLDDVGEFQASLSKLTGRRLKVGKENVRNTAAKRATILEGPLRSKVLEVCAADLEIWQAVQNLRDRSAPDGHRQSVLEESRAKGINAPINPHSDTNGTGRISVSQDRR